MANLTIRNVDDHVVERLKKKAKDNNRSLEDELRELLKHAAHRRDDTRRSSDGQRGTPARRP